MAAMQIQLYQGSAVRADKTLPFTLSHCVSDLNNLSQDALQWLSNNETHYFNSLKFDRRRHSFLLGRYCGKRCLAGQLLRYQQQWPLKQLDIQQGVFTQPIANTPALAEPQGISISHSGQHAVAVAFPLSHPMAIDIEAIDSNKLEACRSEMTKQEITEAGRLSQGVAVNPDIHTLGLLWTAKEALSKILNTGMMTPFKLFETQKWQKANDRCWQAEYTNFAQYKVLVQQQDNWMVALALPRKSDISVDLLQQLLKQ